MRIIDIIDKKKKGKVLSGQEIQFWIDGIMDKSELYRKILSGQYVLAPEKVDIRELIQNLTYEEKMQLLEMLKSLKNK